VPRRLCHFREGLYDHVMYDISKAVKRKYFHGAPFALRGGPPGTGKRLRAWCEALSAVINAGEVLPSTVARLLRWGEREQSRTWTLDGMSREYTGASREGTWGFRENTFGMREGTWASREGTLVSREGTWASREPSLAGREYSLVSNTSKRAPAVREGTATSIALGEVARATGDVERTGGGVTLRFGTPLPPVQRSAIPWYLQRYGYQAADPDRWVENAMEGIWPYFSISAKGSYEMFAHTWYCVHVSLVTPGTDSEPGKTTSWTVPRRLCQFQDGLLEYVKKLPAAVHKEHFRGVPFASRGGPVGTAEKLNGWCAALSAAVNSGRAPPSFVACCLRWAEHPTAVVWGMRTDYSAEAGQGMLVDNNDNTVLEKIVPTEAPPPLDGLYDVIENEVQEGTEVPGFVEIDRRAEEEDILRAISMAQATVDSRQDIPDIDVDKKDDEDDILRAVSLAQTKQDIPDIDV